MANLTPDTRLEQILNGDLIEPVTRLEEFLMKAVHNGGNDLAIEAIEEDGSVTLVNATLSDIAEAHAAHRPCFIDLNTGDRVYLAYCNYTSDDACEIIFSASVATTEVGADTLIFGVVFRNSATGGFIEKVVTNE